MDTRLRRLFEDRGGSFGELAWSEVLPDLHYLRNGRVHELVAGGGDLDILLTHDAPAGVRFERHCRGEGFVSEAAGLDELLARTQPRVCFFGHHHTRLDAEVAGVRCLGLNKGHIRGALSPSR